MATFPVVVKKYWQVYPLLHAQ
jgi:hypothetical protein